MPSFSFFLLFLVLVCLGLLLPLHTYIFAHTSLDGVVACIPGWAFGLENTIHTLVTNASSCFAP